MILRLFLGERLVLIIMCLCIGSCALAQINDAEKSSLSSIADYEKMIKKYRYSDPDSAVYFVHSGLAFARRTKNLRGEGLVLLQLGMIQDNKGDFKESKKTYNQALELFDSIKSKDGIASATIRIGVVELRNGNYDEAVKYFLNALKTAEEDNNQFGIMEANYSISWAYLDQSKYEEALYYLNIAAKIDEKLTFSSTSLNILNHFGKIYKGLRQRDKAKEKLEKGIKLSDGIVEYQGLNISMINNLATVYAEEGNKEKAIALQIEALNRSRKIGNYLRELQTLSGLARTYGTGHPNEAIYYLRQAILLARKKSAYKQEIKYLKQITPYFVAIGNYKEALLLKERENALSDSIFYKSMEDNITSLKAEYELSKSEAKIVELNLLNKKRELELSRAAIIRNVTLGGVLLLLLIIGLLFSRYRIKQKSNLAINEKNKVLQKLLQEKEWLLKEVHHRVKNNLQTVVSLLESQSHFLKNEALFAIQGSQNRVHTMALIHQKLYQEENVGSIDMTQYLPELITHLRESFGIKNRIGVNLQLDPILLDVAQAVPIGLIINEAVTNSFKYAFPGNVSNQQITISMKIKDKNRLVEFLVADNGIGLSPSKCDGGQLGLRLIKGLADDLGGALEIRSDGGTIIKIEFQATSFYQSSYAEKSNLSVA